MGRDMPFEPFAKACDRSAWQGLPEPLRAKLISDGEKRLGYAYPAITAADWLRYSRDGNRTNFESKYFERRRALGSLVLAECAENKGRFADDILNGIFAICEESAWQLPAHNSYVRDTPALPLPDVSKPLLDLFACETGALLAMVVYLLGETLGALQDRVAYELEKRILKPYEQDWYWWMGGRGESTNNWTAWCTQNILLTAFLTPLPEERRAGILHKAKESLDYFLTDYAEDGCCDEGAQYYRHAGLCLYGALDIIDCVTGGAEAEIWRTEKVKNIAHYILDVHVDGKYYINFADCSPAAGYAGAREYLFGKRVGDAALCDFAAAQRRECGELTLPEEISLHHRLQSVFTAQEMSERVITANDLHREVYYPSTGLFIARDEGYCLSVKAGDNNDSHNHNDTGSFTLYKNGKPYFIDVGVESYTQKTFSPQRYEIWTMQSSLHNLPDFDGVQQKNGEEYRTADVSASFGETESSIQMRLERAWPSEAGLTSYVRGVYLQKGVGITITDECEGNFSAATQNLMFCVKPVIGDSTIELPGLGEVRVEGAKSIRLEEIPINDARLRLVWPEMLYRVRLGFDHKIILHIW